MRRRAQVRYWTERGAWGTITKRDQTLAATAVDLSRRLTRLRTRAKAAVVVPIRMDVPRALPAPPARTAAAKRRHWTDNDAWAALVAFTAAEGRPPRARDFPGNPHLPSYAKVHDLRAAWGRRPSMRSR